MMKNKKFLGVIKQREDDEDNDEKIILINPSEEENYFSMVALQRE